MINLRYERWVIDCFYLQLNMEAEKLEKNAIAIIQDVQKIKPKRPEPFITK